MKTHVVIKSSNAKIGPMAATYRTQDTCPKTCPLLGNGCYAAGRIFGIPQKLGREDVEAVRALADRQLPAGVRFNVSGDFLLEDGSPDLEYINACNDVALAHPNALKIAYTHAWRDLDPALFDFAVNASCETEVDVLEALALGWQAVMVNGPVGEKIAGRNVIQCPAETRDVSCADCGACGADKRTRPIVSFTAHGGGKNKATAAVQARRELVPA